MRSIVVAIITLMIFFCLPGIAQVPEVSEGLKSNIQARVDNGVNAGIVVGVISSEGSSFYSYGLKSMESEEPVDEHSVFEIGSISKTFTTTILAKQVVDGALDLQDPVQDLLPEAVKAPTRNGESIKMVHLANHRSSFPRMSSNFAPEDPANPFADYSEEQLYAFLNEYELPRDIGSEYEYSNYAMGLLGHILAAQQKKSYEELVLENIARPLGMQQTSINMSPDMKQHLAFGHSIGQVVPNWDLDVMAGAGAIRSTAADMLKYIAANMGIQKSELYTAMQLAHKHSSDEEHVPRVGLGWHLAMQDGKEVVWHNGGTGGYCSFAGFIKGGDLGVVVLSNSNENVDDIGMHVLNPKAELEQPKPSISYEMIKVLNKEGIDAATKTYWKLKDTQADHYNFAEDQLNALGYSLLAKEEVEKAIAVFKINVDAYPASFNVYDSYGEGLMIKGEKEEAIQNYKKSVELNPGNANGIAMLQKMGVETDGLIKDVVVEEAILETYVGQYELAPGFVVAISKEAQQLQAQATGQGKFDIFPKSENVFYYKVVNAQITFHKSDNGEVNRLTLLQGGQEIEGLRVKE